MKKWFAIGAVFFSIYLVFVVALMPASFVLSLVNVPKDIAIETVTGTVWQANISQITYKKIILQKASASLRFWSLFTLDPTIDIRFGDAMLPGPEGELTLSGLHSNIHVNQANILVSANDIAKQLSLPLPVIAGGNVTVALDDFILGKPICQQAQGKIHWKKATILAFDQKILLGKLSAAISCEQGALGLTLDPKNDLGLSFTAYVRSKGVSGNGYLTPGEKFPASLKTVLPFIGKPDNEGRYRLNF